MDVKLPDGDGTDLLKQLQSRPVKPLVVIISGFGTVDMAVECMSNGAFTFLTKPFSPEQLAVVLKKAEEHTQLVKVNQFLSHGEDDESRFELLGQSKPVEQLRQLIRKVARTQATVLIQGESGTGKELVARALYRESPRGDAPFIKVNCAAIPENLIESEFFGHEKGAFTGALTKREGRFELAHGGTILLDEISEISPQVQAKLLRVLQERELERVGGNRTIKVDVRVIATTNRQLEESVERKEFRQDLYFRLNVVPVIVPPLRERKEDIPILATQFRERFVRKHGIHVVGMSPACMEELQRHNWPGNVRELQNVIERAVILCNEGGVLEPAHLGLTPNTMEISTPIARPATFSMTTPMGASVTQTAEQSADFQTLSEIEKHHILAALEHCKGNRTHAAKILDISIRTLRNKLNEYGYKNQEANAPTEVGEI
ncbi:MAG: two component, sigma54 specific, transcriptional regulator, Fis family [Verrucomicrobiales bacterium]|nr:two component, sigma54 specific, transcriptional regulator, Fis family [Verrucomicrobiales bacterium]